MGYDLSGIPDRTVAIIGHKGKFGQVLADRFRASGYKVIGSDIKTGSSNIEVVKKADVVVVAVGMFEFESVVREVVPWLRAGQLFMEIRSIKESWVDLMLTSQSSVIGLHPMWSHRDDWRGKQLVVCPSRPGPWLPWVENFFSSFGVEIVIMTPAEHDYLAAIVQGLIHPVNLLGAEVMRRLGVRIEEALKIATPLFRINADQKGRLLSQDPELFAGLLFLNENTVPVLRLAQTVLGEMVDIIVRQDLPAFKELFAVNRESLGSFVPEASKRTGKLIDFWQTHQKDA